MKQDSKKRIAIMVSLLVLVVGGLIVTDDGDLSAMATCATTGAIRFLPAEPIDFEADYYGYPWRGNTENLIDASIYLSGGWEQPVLNAIRDALIETAGEKKGFFLDIGANVGTHSFFAVRYAKTVYAVEPWPPVLQRMETFIKDNKIENVEIHPVGYASEAGVMPFEIPPGDNLGIGTFSHTRFETKGGVIQLPLVVGDEDLEKRGVTRIDVIKIDIEGYEKPALYGLRKTMERDRPVVFLELNSENDEGFHSLDELKQTFPKNYRFFEVESPRDFMLNLPGGARGGCLQVAGDYEYQPFTNQFGGEPRMVVAIAEEAAEKLVLKSRE